MYAFPYLSRLIATQMFARLVAMMPPPLEASPESRRNRDAVAMAMLKQMGPIRSVEEASLAITIVAADAHAHDALRGAAENSNDMKVVMQCRAQMNTMMRTRHRAATELEALMRSREAAERRAELAAEATAEAAERPPVPEAPTPRPASHPVVSNAPTVEAGRLSVTNKDNRGVNSAAPRPHVTGPRVTPVSTGHMVGRRSSHETARMIVQ